MLDSVALDHAAGIIANFTGGPDLTLFEVEEALTHLQEQTSSQTEIVLGVINDERMEERVQVTLIVTGLGAPTLEETLSKVSLAQSVEVKTAALPIEAPVRPCSTSRSNSTAFVATSKRERHRSASLPPPPHPIRRLRTHNLKYSIP